VATPAYTTVPEQSSPAPSTPAMSVTAAEDLVTLGKKQMRAMNYDKAKSTFTQAVDQGSLEAVYQLGMLYSNNNYDGYNKETALDYFLKAANNYHVEAMYQAGMMYLGTDNSAAKSWLQKAASNGHSRAQAQLSRLR
jgi:TPR repeat protein